ncbi:hypothetical protein BGZ73_004746 [Actinomortierella ambigua]|nr:hypothetical protein BGZ73_004746 [Actinomortierella ambigua]
MSVVSSALSLDYGLEADDEDDDEDEVEIIPRQSYQAPQPPSQLAMDTNTKPFVDWRVKCQERARSERHWASGSIQSACLLSAHHGGIVRLRIKDHEKLLSGDMFGRVALWDLRTMQCETCFEAAVGPIQLMDFSAKRGIMAVVSSSGQELIHSEVLSDIACMTMDDRYLVLGDESGTIRLVDFATGTTLRSTAIQGQVLQNIYIQNDTMVVVTFNDIHIICLETLKTLSHAVLPTSKLIFAYCSVFHIRSLILLIENQLIHMEWEPLYKPLESPLLADGTADDDSHRHQATISTTMLDYELPPDLSRPPRMYRTSVPPIATITSIAIGGKHPHVLTTNADYPSLENTIRICGKPAPRRPRSPSSMLRSSRSPSCASASSSVSSLLSSSSSRSSSPAIYSSSEGGDSGTNAEYYRSATGAPSTPSCPSPSTVEEKEQEQDTGVVLLHSPVPEVSKFLSECGLKPSFMDVDEDIVVVGTDKGEIVVLNMLQ